MGSSMEYQEKIGEYLLRMNEIRPNQVENVLLRQQCGDRRKFGEIALDLRYIDEASLKNYLNVSSLPLWKGKSGPSGGPASRIDVNRSKPDRFKVSGGWENEYPVMD